MINNSLFIEQVTDASNYSSRFYTSGISSQADVQLVSGVNLAI